MKVLVISDSHGKANNVCAALEKESDCTMVFFLGDGIRDIELIKKGFPDKNFVCVSGNNDFYSDLPDTAYKYIDGCVAVATHGHKYRVKYGLNELFKHAEAVRANVVFYGHTHIADIRYDSYSGIYAVNPGAMYNGRYAVAQISKNGIDVEFKSIVC